MLTLCTPPLRHTLLRAAEWLLLGPTAGMLTAEMVAGTALAGLFGLVRLEDNFRTQMAIGCVYCRSASARTVPEMQSGQMPNLWQTRGKYGAGPAVTDSRMVESLVWGNGESVQFLCAVSGLELSLRALTHACRGESVQFPDWGADSSHTLARLPVATTGLFVILLHVSICARTSYNLCLPVATNGLFVIRNS